MKVIVLRQDSEALLPSLVAALAKVVGDIKYVYLERTDPQTAEEHLQACQEKNPSFVLLVDRPIPSLAMDAGFRHVIMTPNGLMEVKGFDIKLEPFVP